MNVSLPLKAGERGNSFLRAADRVAGIPAIALVGIAKRLFRRGPRNVPEQPRVVGLLKASGIGDAIILSGVIRDVRAKYPSARLVLFSGRSNHAFAKLLDDVDEVVALPIDRPHVAMRLVRAAKPDIMIDFGMWPRLEAMLAALSGAAFIVGVKTPGQHRHFAYDIAIPHSTEHEITNYRNLVAALGIQSRSMPSLRAGTGEISPLNRPYAALHLWPGGANSEERSWPVDRWRLLARALNRRGYTVALTGGPADATGTRALVDEWRSDGIDAISIAGVAARDTIVWLRHAEGAVSVNTGLLHLAAALGTPVVALNGPTSGRRWGPLGRYTRCIQSPMVPEGYLNLGWERDERYSMCMEAIRFGTVITAWDDLMTEVACTKSVPYVSSPAYQSATG